MNKKLGDIMVQRNILTVDTEIEAWHKVPEFGGGDFDKLDFFTVNSIDKRDGETCFHARSNIDGKWHDFTYSNIVTIDGMAPERIANAFRIKI